MRSSMRWRHAASGSVADPAAVGDGAVVGVTPIVCARVATGNDARPASAAAAAATQARRTGHGLLDPIQTSRLEPLACMNLPGLARGNPETGCSTQDRKSTRLTP